MEKLLVIIRGLPGSGKTTLAKALAGEVYPICAEDDYYHNPDGSYEWTKEKESKAILGCLNDTVRSMLENTPKIFVTNVFLTQADIDLYINTAKKFGYQYHVLIAQNLHGNKSVHNVKPEDFEEMKSKFEVLL